jgi:hypothetical protein
VNFSFVHIKMERKLKINKTKQQKLTAEKKKNKKKNYKDM